MSPPFELSKKLRTDVLGERADEIAAGLEAARREEKGAAGGGDDMASDSSGGIGGGLSMAEGAGVQGGGTGSEEEWVANPSKMPIWKLPVVSRASVEDIVFIPHTFRYDFHYIYMTTLSSWRCGNLSCMNDLQYVSGAAQRVLFCCMCDVYTSPVSANAFHSVITTPESQCALPR